MTTTTSTFTLAPGENMTQCPYNLSHRITNTKFLTHLAKCRSNYTAELEKLGKKVEMIICKFNYTHQVPVVERELHESGCRDRYSIVEHIVYHSNDEFKNKLKQERPDEAGGLSRRRSLSRSPSPVSKSRSRSPVSKSRSPSRSRSPIRIKPESQVHDKISSDDEIIFIKEEKKSVSSRSSSPVDWPRRSTRNRSRSKSNRRTRSRSSRRSPVRLPRPTKSRRSSSHSPSPPPSTTRRKPKSKSKLKIYINGVKQEKRSSSSSPSPIRRRSFTRLGRYDDDDSRRDRRRTRSKDKLRREEKDKPRREDKPRFKREDKHLKIRRRSPVEQKILTTADLGDENWDEDCKEGYEPGYDPKVKLENENVLYNPPEGLKKAERKLFRQENRKKLEQSITPGPSSSSTGSNLGTIKIEPQPAPPEQDYYHHQPTAYPIRYHRPPVPPPFGYGPPPPHPHFYGPPPHFYGGPPPPPHMMMMMGGGYGPHPGMIPPHHRPPFHHPHYYGHPGSAYPEQPPHFIPRHPSSPSPPPARTAPPLEETNDIKNIVTAPPLVIKPEVKQESRDPNEPFEEGEIDEEPVIEVKVNGVIEEEEEVVDYDWHSDQE